MIRNLFIWSIMILSVTMGGQNHPCLILTRTSVEQMKKSLDGDNLFNNTYLKTKNSVNEAIAHGIDVPFPKDLAGGYTHEVHKANFFNMQKAGILFQLSDDEKYAIYIRDMLLKYADIYHQFDQHPATRSYARGKFFWQCLNDANWLVYSSQAYDCIYDWLDKKTIKKLNNELFRPYAEYISIKNPQFFNRIHNHSTWGNVAVGMTGIVIGDDELVQWALYGLGDGPLKGLGVDNDGGDIIMQEQRTSGFYAQLDNSFSPQGYYTEGPYYQRYAIYPFLIFAQALENNLPESQIFNYRDEVLIKSVYTLINLTNENGEFFPINDAQKGMSLSSRELVTAVSVAFFYGTNDHNLLSIIIEQGRVPLSICGLESSQAIADKSTRVYKKNSFVAWDGKEGNEGAVSVLRSSSKPSTTLVLKYAKHGMGHGHFDRLGFLLFDRGAEVFQDYGSARWVNIEHKEGGGYLPENHTWAKQTVAHNSLVINEVSQFNGVVKAADSTHGEHLLFDTTLTGVQVVRARERNAYRGWELTRTMAMLDLPDCERPLVLDLLHATSSDSTSGVIDLPLYYVGEFMSSNLQIYKYDNLVPLGNDFGYQHLWKEASAYSTDDSLFSMTWFNEDRFYSLTSSLDRDDEIVFTRIGANDPNFNLRHDPGIIIRRNSNGNSLFTQAYELHGSYNRSDEIPINSFSKITDLKQVYSTDDYSAVRISMNNGNTYTFVIAQKNLQNDAIHNISIKGAPISWKGAYHLFSDKTN